MIESIVVARRKTGPKPSCVCGQCATCLHRIAALRRYHGTIYPSIAAGRFRASKLRLPVDDSTIGYLAGLMDGEGCITRQNGSWRVQLAMTDEALIRWLGEFGGTVKRHHNGHGNRQPCWAWLICAQEEVREFLVLLLPYLHVKGERARTALADIEARADARRRLGVT